MSTGKDKTNGMEATGPETSTLPGKSRKPWWRRILRAAAWAIGTVTGLTVLAMCLVAWILTPERLTPLVEKYGSEYLKADVKAERVELTIWSSFPDIRLDVSGLRLDSRTLQGQPDSVLSALGPDADRLLTARHLSASVNPWRLACGTIALGDIKAEGLGLNLVSYGEGVNNYDIIPASEDEDEEKADSSPWEIRFGDIDIEADGGLRYLDAQGGTDVFLASLALNVSPADQECRQLDTSLKGRLTLKTDGENLIAGWPLELRGRVHWNPASMEFSLPDYSLYLSIFSARLRTEFSVAEQLCLKSCRLDIDPISVSTLLKNLPADLSETYPAIKGIDTDMAPAISVEVACPWMSGSPDLPDVEASLNMPPCRLSVSDNGKELLRLDKLTMRASAHYDGAKPENSHLSVPLLGLEGAGMSLSLELRVSELLGDNPLVSLLSRGELELGAVSALMPYAGSALKGTVQADAELRGRLDDIMNLRYENIEADGNMMIRDLACDIPQLATSLYSKLARLRFGNAVDDMGPRIPGTLLARAEIDTLHMCLTGIEIGIREACLKAGAKDDMLRGKNDKAITPMGMSFTAASFRMDSKADTTKVRAKALSAVGSLTRYEGNAASPLLKACLSSTGLLYADPTLRLGMKGFSSDLEAHLRKRKHRKRKGASARKVEENVVRPDVDAGIKNLFKTWGISGNLASDKVRLTHLMYPVPVNVSGLDLDFSLDSVRLHSARIKTQANSLTLSGTISSLRQFVLGRTRTPLKLRLNADIDSIDINQVAYNVMLGTAMAHERGHLARLSEEEQDAIVKAAASVDTVQSLASDSTPLIIPRNIDAIFRLKAGKALYGDISLHRMRTDLIVNDGAASVDSLQASTDFGDAYMNLLYSSRNPELLNLAIDLGFSDIDLQGLFRTFPAITEVAPAITDLSGMAGARLVGSCDMYPNMDIDFGSMNAVLNLTGSDLRLRQSPLIRKVARMMLIRKDGPLDISDMDIQIALHDNVVRLYPFKFGMEKYRFALLGQNDMAENMFYHLSVLKSPIPFRFGINIKGTFDKPKIRFGGAKYKENEAQEMVNLVEAQRVNFVKAMRLELRKLVNKAAVTYAERPEFSAYGIDKEMTAPDSDTDDSAFGSPTEMLGSSLQAPTIKALGKSGEALREFARKYEIGQDKNPGKKKTDKKK